MDAEGDGESKALFAQVQFHIVKTDNFPADHAAAVCLTRLLMFAQSLYEVLNLAGKLSRAKWRPGSTTIIRGYYPRPRGHTHYLNNN